MLQGQSTAFFHSFDMMAQEIVIGYQLTPVSYGIFMNICWCNLVLWKFCLAPGYKQKMHEPL